MTNFASNKDTRRQGYRETGRQGVQDETPRAELPQDKCLELLALGFAAWLVQELLVYMNII